MGMYRHKMPDREISKEMEKANFWEAEADMWHQNYKEATNEIERLQGILRLITELSPFKLNPGHASLKFFAEMPPDQEISFCSVRLIEITTLAHEALKEKE